jgi:integrase
MKLYPDLYQLYASSSGALNTPKSKEDYRSVLRACQWYDPILDLEDWQVDNLEFFCRSGDVAPGTVRWRKSILMSVFSWATYRGYIAKDPAAALKHRIRPNSTRVRVGNWLTGAEVETIWNSLDPTDEMQARDRILFALGLFTGLRLSELAGLTWDQFDRDMQYLRVKGKGNKIVDQPVAEQLRAELVPWRETALGPAVLPSFMNVWREHGRERIIDWDRPLLASGIYRAVKQLGKLVGKDIATHDLRRSFVSWLREQGLDPATIRDLARHASIQTTFDIYLDRDPGRLGQAMNGLRRTL